MESTASHHHRLCLSTDLMLYEGSEVFDHYFRLLSEIVGMEADISSKGGSSLPLVDLRIISYGFGEP